MSRLIDADALRESIITRQTEISYEDAWALTCVDNAPTIKPQHEIIRCKDCKHWHNAPASDGYNSCEKDALIRHESFFCADAKLRGESDDN